MRPTRADLMILAHATRTEEAENVPIAIEPNIHRSACQTCPSTDIADVRDVRFAPPAPSNNGGNRIPMCSACRKAAARALTDE